MSIKDLGSQNVFAKIPKGQAAELGSSTETIEHDYKLKCGDESQAEEQS